MYQNQATVNNYNDLHYIVNSILAYPLMSSLYQFTTQHPNTLVY